MKKIFIVLAALLVLSASPVYAAESGREETRTISVSGEGSVSVAPDLAVLSIGVTTDGETTSVQQENAAVMEKVIAAIKASGVADADIVTENYSLSPEYDYENINKDGRNEINGYTMTHMLSVTVRDVDKAGEVLSGATEAGANQNWGISFNISDPDKYYGDALAEAIKNAEGKAKIIASTIGVTIGKPISVNESGGYAVPYASRSFDMGGGAYEVAVDAAMPAPVSAGQMDITASVSLTYSY